MSTALTFQAFGPTIPNSSALILSMWTLRRCPGGQAEVTEDLRNDGGCSMAAMIFKGPPQRGQCSRSISNTRLSKRAQLRRAGAAAGGASAWSAEGDWALTRKAYGFRTYHGLEVALYHALGALPEPQFTYRFS